VTGGQKERSRRPLLDKSGEDRPCWARLEPCPLYYPDDIDSR